MFYVLLFLLLINGIFMGVIVLLQSGKGGGLASMGGGSGTDTLIGGRQAATLLTKATWVSGGLFLTLALVLSVMSTRQQTAAPLLRDEFQQRGTAPAPAPMLPGSQSPEAGPQSTAPQAPPAAAPQGQQQTSPPTRTNQ